MSDNNEVDMEVLLKGEKDNRGKARSIPELSADTRLVYERLLKLKQGEMVSYSELKDILGGADPQVGAGYARVASARRKALNDDRFNIEAVIGEGMKRLDDTEIVHSSSVAIRSIRRKARQGVKKATCVTDYENMSSEDKVSHNAIISMLGALHQATGTRSFRRIAKKVKEVQDTLSIGKTLELFK